MDGGILLLAALTGCLFGSLSFARLVTRLVAPNTTLTPIREPVPNRSEVFVLDTVSATTVRMQVGTQYGCLTALLDMAKVALPALAFKLWQPDTPYYLVVAALGVVGHNWPLYHRFKGGRGESAIIGGVLVVDWVGLVVTHLVGFVLGLAVGSMLVLRWAGLLLLVPWMGWRFGDWAHPAYMLFVNLVYLYSILPELRQYFALRATTSLSQEELGRFLSMGQSLGRWMDRYSLPAQWNRRRARRTARAGTPPTIPPPSQ